MKLKINFEDCNSRCCDYFPKTHTLTDRSGFALVRSWKQTDRASNPIVYSMIQKVGIDEGIDRRPGQKD